MLLTFSINILFFPVYALKSQLQTSLFFLPMSLVEVVLCLLSAPMSLLSVAPRIASVHDAFCLLYCLSPHSMDGAVDTFVAGELKELDLLRSNDARPFSPDNCLQTRFVERLISALDEIWDRAQFPS